MPTCRRSAPAHPPSGDASPIRDRAPDTWTAQDGRRGASAPPASLVGETGTDAQAVPPRGRTRRRRPDARRRRPGARRRRRRPARCRAARSPGGGVGCDSRVGRSRRAAPQRDAQPGPVRSRRDGQGPCVAGDRVLRAARADLVAVRSERVRAGLHAGAGLRSLHVPVDATACRGRRGRVARRRADALRERQGRIDRVRAPGVPLRIR